MHSKMSRIRLAGLELAVLLATGSMATAKTVQLKGRSERVESRR
jgi:hypothetical protein